MTGYSTYWRTTIFASAAFHFLAALGFSYVLPHLIPEPKIEEVIEIEWVEAELPEDVVIVEADVIPAEPVQETLPIFNPEDLVIPEIEIPEPVVEPEPEPEPKVEETPPPPPQVLEENQDIQKELEENPDKEIVVVPKNGKHLMGQPPVTVTEFYPPKGSGLRYKGYVSVAATIGKDGKVKKTKIMRTSGRMLVDGLAQDYASKWTFKPALDQEGKPMECDKIITFDFKKFA